MYESIILAVDLDSDSGHVLVEFGEVVNCDFGKTSYYLALQFVL